MRTLSLHLQTTVRSWARRLGLISALVRLRNIVRPTGPAEYEDAFGCALLASVRNGDCVWDVGANVGFYSRLLKRRVGSAGLVCAFEPAPECYEKLLSEQDSSLQVFNIALGQAEGKMALALANDPLGTTHSLVETVAGKSVLVQVMPGDLMLQLHGLRVPNVIKIDVEGFEEEVIAGLATTLSTKNCRAVFCEVHFGILDRRGERHAPLRIEKTLKGHGFSTCWVDSSHMAAVKPSPTSASQ